MSLGDRTVSLLLVICRDFIIVLFLFCLIKLLPRSHLWNLSFRDGFYHFLAVSLSLRLNGYLISCHFSPMGVERMLTVFAISSLLLPTILAGSEL